MISKPLGTQDHHLSGAAAGWLLTLPTLASAFMFGLIPFLEINWDEFRFFANVQSYYRGQLGVPLQTFHVHFFKWLVQAPGTEVNQIQFARVVMALMTLGSSYLIFGIQRALGFPQKSAIFAATLYLTLNYVVVHGASFRFDPIAVFFVLLSTYFVLLGSQRRPHNLIVVILAGSLFAVGCLITVKSVVLVPMAISAFFWDQQFRARAKSEVLQIAVSIRTLIIYFVSALISGFFLYLLHRSSLISGGSIDSGTLLANAANKTVLHSTFFPRKTEWLGSLRSSPFHWFCYLVGISLSVRGYFNSPRNSWLRARIVLIWLFSSPILFLYFYRNAFPYFYVFLMPCLSVIGAYFHEILVNELGSKSRRLAIGLLQIGIILSAMRSGIQAGVKRPVEIQLQVLEQVHALFPVPVPYIDRCSMVAQFPTVGFFMTSWGLENYRAAGKPRFRDLLSEGQPVFVLNNSPSLGAALLGRSDGPLFPEDVHALNENYIQHWGPIWVAGKRIDLTAETEVSIEMPIAGRYTFEAKCISDFDSVTVRNGSVHFITSGIHKVKSKCNQTLILRWGANLPKPTAPAPDGEVFRGF